MVQAYLSFVFFFDVIRMRDPYKRYKENLGRGMSFKTDVIDWFGGFPYEYLTAKEVFNFYNDGHSNLRLINSKTVNNLANNEFLFEKIEYGAESYGVYYKHKYFSRSYQFKPYGKTWFSFFFEDESFRLSFWQMIKVRLPFYYQMLSNNFWINGKNLFAPFFIIAMGSLLIAWKKLWKINLFRVILLLAVTPFIGMLFFQGNQGNVYEYYFTGYFLIFILLISVLLTVFHRKILGKLILVVFVLTFLKMNWSVTTNAIRTGTDGPAAIYLGNEKQIIDWVYEDAGNKTFNVDVYVPPVIPYAYDYLFKWYGGVVHARSPEDKQVALLYTIYEVDNAHPERLNAWLARQAKIGKVEDEIRYGGIVVQRRTRLLYEKNN
jgi:hypothetical protein